MPRRLNIVLATQKLGQDCKTHQCILRWRIIAVVWLHIFALHYYQCIVLFDPHHYRQKPLCVDLYAVHGFVMVRVGYLFSNTPNPLLAESSNTHKFSPAPSHKLTNKWRNASCCMIISSKVFCAVIICVQECVSSDLCGQYMKMNVV